MRFHVLSLLFAAAFSFAIVGCGGDSADVSNPQGDAPEEASEEDMEMYDNEGGDGSGDPSGADPGAEG